MTGIIELGLAPFIERAIREAEAAGATQELNDALARLVRQHEMLNSLVRGTETWLRPFLFLLVSVLGCVVLVAYRRHWWNEILALLQG